MAGEIRWDHSAGAEWKIHERISHPLDCSHEFQGLLAISFPSAEWIIGERGLATIAASARGIGVISRQFER
jgi:hypothetical protein